MTKQAINQHLARAEALGDDLPRVTGTSLDKGVELDWLPGNGKQRVNTKHRICRGAVTAAVTAKTALLRRVFPTV